MNGPHSLGDISFYNAHKMRGKRENIYNFISISTKTTVKIDNLSSNVIIYLYGSVV